MSLTLRHLPSLNHRHLPLRRLAVRRSPESHRLPDLRLPGFGRLPDLRCLPDLHRLSELHRLPEPRRGRLAVARFQRGAPVQSPWGFHLHRDRLPQKPEKRPLVA